MRQQDDVIKALKQNGGYATLRRLYETVDFSTWKTKTPEATVRRIVQENHEIFKIQPGLWALESCREEVMRHFKITKEKHSEEVFSHGYYQGLLVEIGKMSRHTTYIPAQDKNRIFLDKTLGEVSDTYSIPPFTYPKILRRAKTVDVIWFNERQMPCHFFEVEHTTDIKNSLEKFYELQDFNVQFSIVAHASRKVQFEDIIHRSIFKAIEKRVKFDSYDKVARQYNGLKILNSTGWQM